MKTNNNMELHEKLLKLHVLRHHQRARECMEQRAPHWQKDMYRILEVLKLKPEMNPEDLAYMLGIHLAHLNQLLDELEARELIERIAGEGAGQRQDMDQKQDTDQAKTIRITELGKSEKKETEEKTDMFDCLTAEEKTVFSEYLDRVLSFLENELGDAAQAIPEWKNREHFHKNRRQGCRRARMQRDDFPENSRGFDGVGFEDVFSGWGGFGYEDVFSSWGDAGKRGRHHEPGFPNAEHFHRFKDRPGKRRQCGEFGHDRYEQEKSDDFQEENK